MYTQLGSFVHVVDTAFLSSLKKKVFPSLVPGWKKSILVNRFASFSGYLL
jgi:hypothetical protein